MSDHGSRYIRLSDEFFDEICDVLKAVADSEDGQARDLLAGKQFAELVIWEALVEKAHTLVSAAKSRARAAA